MKGWQFLLISTVFLLLATWRFEYVMDNKEIVVIKERNVVILGEQPTPNKRGEEDTYIHAPVELNEEGVEKPAPTVTPEKDPYAGFHKIPTIHLRGEPVELDSDLRCLAMSIYFEGRNRTEKTQEAMGWVMINRIGKYGNKNVCDVVTNARTKDLTHVKLYKCHFSWYCEGNETLEVASNPIDDQAYKTAVKVANKILVKQHAKKADITKGATHYHRVDKTPSWRTQMAYLGKYQDHKFYRGN